MEGHIIQIETYNGKFGVYTYLTIACDGSPDEELGVMSPVEVLSTESTDNPSLTNWAKDRLYRDPIEYEPKEG